MLKADHSPARAAKAPVITTLVKEHRFAEHVGDLGAVLLGVVHLICVHVFGARDHAVQRHVRVHSIA